MSLLDFTTKENSVFGLDIGYETIKLVQVNRKQNEIDLVGFTEVPLSERILERDRFKNKAYAANLIKEACSKAKPSTIRAKKIVSALPETFVFSKTIQMPKMTVKEYEKAIPAEAAQYLPIPVEEVYIDFQVLIIHPDDPRSDVLVVASPKKLVDEYVEVVKMAGFELVALETKPIAVGRAASINQPLDGSLILEIGTEVSRVSIWDNNSIRLITSIAAGKNQIAESLAFTDNQGTMPDNDPALDRLSNEVLSAISYHQSRDYNPKPIKEILICGSGATINNIDQALEKILRLKVNIVKPKFNDKNELGTEFITSYGLALRQEYY